MAYEMILLNIEGRIATISLNRPPMNPLNSVILREITEAISEIEADENVKVVIVNSVGERAFAAGADVKEMVNLTPVELYDFCQGFRKACESLNRYALPVIAVIKGLTLGGGCELAMACDLRIAAENAKFGQPEINLGILPGAGGTQRLTRLIGPARSKEMILTGDMIDAATAERYGLVNKVVPLEDVDKAAMELAEKLASKPKVALKMAKAAINAGQNVDLGSGLDFEILSFALASASEDKLEGMTALLEKRKANFKDK
ncbi:MAG: putative enoyl-CoA hydratase echA8 [Syntrophus sp. PtaU1.Bin005]|jgi:enoyl-CoA hydratase|uniref:enoyl-CoA hydratase/isomerase family protein n=1 Tax=Syntrophus TaxID=43773 RepID=UPI0009D5B87E|nr:MAG: putative enoyl-CoA hydratase echA8 [Syntrophus sp. PtaB.Bin138]OPY82253.1 MAG: putative enoyl-CoA hydratase echA8 [Syntrophus sp. PtaU1.Bin005]